MANMLSGAMNPQQQAPQSAPPASLPGAAAAGAAAASAAVPAVMTLEEAAAYLKVDAADVQAAIEAGDIKAKKIGSQYRISKDAVDAFLSS